MKKLYADHTNQVTIICPKCGLERKIDVTKFKETHKRLKARCRCGEVFRFTLEYRRHYRKKVRLAGEYLVQGKDERGEVIIEDISASGIRFASLRPHFISRNDIVELKFALDNPTKTRVQKLVKIIWTRDQDMGAQFNDPKSIERDFDAYLKQ